MWRTMTLLALVASAALAVPVDAPKKTQPVDSTVYVTPAGECYRVVRGATGRPGHQPVKCPAKKR